MKTEHKALRSFFAIAASLTCLGTIVVSCAPTEFTCDGDATCPSSGASGASADGGNAGSLSGSGGIAGANAGGGSGDAGTAGSGIANQCDTAKTPSEQPCLVSDDYAVFVAPNGKSNAAGTMSAPLSSLTAAVTLAAGTKRVIVCNATYNEHVVISSGAAVYGGFSCADGKWASAEMAALFKPNDAGAALKIDAVTEAVILDTVNFEVSDAKEIGDTALTAIVNSSPNVTLKKVSLTAGGGMNGADGSLIPFTYPQALDGNPETAGATGGGQKVCACQGSLMSVGGNGGPPVIGGQSGSQGQPDHGGGQPGIPGSCGTTGTGKDGLDAQATGPSSGAVSLGTVSVTGWNPTSGLDGTNGSPGQGGGGGASRNDLGHGGGGGCGGCGGNGSKAGRGGGGSIALLALDSPITLEDCTLKTTNAGNGGAGVTGQPGQSDFGNGGLPISLANSCPGGNGGKGGDGGASGGGAGGISVGIVWKGTSAPVITSTMIITGKAGAKGVGGIPGTNDGIVGVKQDVIQAL